MLSQVGIHEKTTISQDYKIQLRRDWFDISGLIVCDCLDRQRQFFHGDAAAIACNDGVHRNIFCREHIRILSDMDQ